MQSATAAAVCGLFRYISDGLQLVNLLHHHLMSFAALAFQPSATDQIQSPLNSQLWNTFAERHVGTTRDESSLQLCFLQFRCSAQLT